MMGSRVLLRIQTPALAGAAGPVLVKAVHLMPDKFAPRGLVLENAMEVMETAVGLI